jgi:serine/threonine-protein kinase
VAVKVLNTAAGADPSFRERFLRESAMAVHLGDHPAIVPVYDAGEDDGSLFIVMRYVEGTDLGRAIDAHGPVPPPTLVSILTQVAGALDVAHAGGLVHRDVKPGNVLLTSDLERAFLADFGLTKRIDTDQGLTQAHQYLGTTYYSAPEQFEGFGVGPAADVYALGAVLYHCLTGSPPFRGTPESVIAAHLTKPVPAVTALRPDLPASIDWVVAKAMAKAPEHRYRSAGELAADTALALTGGEVATAGPVAPASFASSTFGPGSVGPAPASVAPAYAPPSRQPPGKPAVPWLVTGVVAVAAVVMAVVVGVVLLGGGDGDGDGQFPTEEEAAVLATLPDGVARECRRDTDVDHAGATAAVRCDLDPAGGAATASFVSFESVGALGSAYRGLLEAAEVEDRPADDCATSPEAAHEYQGAGVEGEVFCARDIGRYTMTWTDDVHLVLGVAERDDNDDAALYTWWSTMVGRADGPTPP